MCVYTYFGIKIGICFTLIKQSDGNLFYSNTCDYVFQISFKESFQKNLVWEVNEYNLFNSILMLKK